MSDVVELFAFRLSNSGGFCSIDRIHEGLICFEWPLDAE